MASENIGSVYPTKIPGLEDPADIQAALRLYHYGTTNTISTEEDLIADSVAGHIKALDTRIDAIELDGIGSEISDTMPTGVDNGFIWVNSTGSAQSLSVPIWKLKGSGSLSGESLSVSSLDGEKLFIILKDWSHDNAGSVDFSLRFNADSGPNYVNTGGLVSASHLSSPEFPASGTYDMTVTVDLANTESSLKPVSTIADIATGSYFGYYKNTSPITSIQISLPTGTAFDSGSYEVWSYE
jgi:hypothetical protein